jgi:hypothetical protein
MIQFLVGLVIGGLASGVAVYKYFRYLQAKAQQALQYGESKIEIAKKLL